MTDVTPRQKEIMETAMRLIAEKGIQKCTIKNVSRHIGISEPAIYRHFESKMDILLGILSCFKQRTKATSERIRSSESTAIKQIESIFVGHVHQFTADPTMAAVIFSEEIFQNDRRLSEEVFSIMKLSQDTMLEIIEKGQSNGEIRSDIPKEQLALILMGALRLMVTKWRLSGFSFDLEKEGTDLWNALRKIIEL
ncbi:MAG: TetR/AcrR family transcriptional regulator [Candidatus Latescibacterota bacterium]|nr:MAG: TetR/AcrR family transcriptional regulator [Candidatus Latescibacterota bacterium]